MVNATNPWLGRGGWPPNGANAGVFYFNNADGRTVVERSFRQTLITSKNIKFVKSILKQNKK